MKRIVLAILAVLMLATPVVAENDEVYAEYFIRLADSLNEIGYYNDGLTGEEAKDIVMLSVVAAKNSQSMKRLCDDVEKVLHKRIHLPTYESIVIGYALGLYYSFKVANEVAQ